LTVAQIYPQLVLNALPAFSGIDTAAGGKTLADRATQFVTNVCPAVNSGIGPNRDIYVIDAGTNDLYFGATASSTYTNLVALTTLAHACGFYTVWLSILPRGGSAPAGFETARQAVNAAVRANLAAAGVDALADVGADPTIGVAGADTNTTYYQDQVHLTAAGHAIVANYVVNAIDSLADVPIDGNTYIAGNLGIGTTSPSQALSVAGNINYTGNLYQNGTLVSTGGSSQWTTASNSAIFFNAGNVGIGTSTPTQSLSVAGNLQLTGALFDGANTSGTAGMLLQTTGGGVRWVATSTLGLGGGSSQWVTSSSSIYFNTGNVSIGTSTASTLFSVGTSTNIFNVLSSGAVSIGTSTPANGLTFQVANASSSDALVVASSGFVGIGTPGPTAELQVHGGNILMDNNKYLQGLNSISNPINLIGINSSNNTVMNSNGGAAFTLGSLSTLTNSPFTIGTSSGLTAELGVDNGSGGNYGLLVEGNASQAADLVSFQNSSGTALFRIIPGGYVGIDTGGTAPTTALQVAGSSTIRVGVSGSPWTGCFENYDPIQSSTLVYSYGTISGWVSTTTKPSFCQ
jgi:lysophospholipase L1-like esterase